MILENILIYFVIIPLLMMAGLAVCRNMNQIRTVMTVLSTVLLGLAIYLCVEFLGLRAAGDTADMLFTA